MKPKADLSISHDDMPPLAAVQRWFQSVVSHPDGVDAGIESDDAQAIVRLTRDELELMITRSSKVSARDRISIYANAYYARLIECLGESFPILKRTLGEDVFNGFAFGYLQEYPSRSYTLGRLGDHFPRYLDETRPDRDEANLADSYPAVDWPDFLIDLATLEWTIDQVFDGLGIESSQTLQMEDLIDIAPERWPQMRLTVAPCLRLLRLHYPVNEYYSAVRKAGDDVEVETPGPQECFLVVTRRDFIVRRHEITAAQYELLQSLAQGHPVETAIAAAAQVSDLDDSALAMQLRQWFAIWARSQFFVAIK